uniref:Probable myosin light chain kinase DDB_G0292624 n=1 Tax=Petromyzon marinus TaxID=7757 RepID=A0AAJ7SNY1_PETMA|nr:probable myosin light chain kinase DDB_G0292624 [Petromyzon marinus]
MATNLLNNRYAVLEKLGEGTFGQVFRCWDHRNHKEMALKMIDSTLSVTDAEVYNEAGFLKMLRHKSIIRLEENFVVGDYHYLVLDYINAGSLFDVVNSNGAFTLSSVKRYARSLMEVLAFLKKNGVVHGDLKLENILVKDHHTAAIRLADFGGSFFESEFRKLHFIYIYTHHHISKYSYRSCYLE